MRMQKITYEIMDHCSIESARLMVSISLYWKKVNPHPGNSVRFTWIHFTTHIMHTRSAACLTDGRLKYRRSRREWGNRADRSRCGYSTMRARREAPRS